MTAVSRSGPLLAVGVHLASRGCNVARDGRGTSVEVD